MVQLHFVLNPHSVRQRLPFLALSLFTLSQLFSVSRAAENWKPVADAMLTQWAQKVQPDNVWSEYPRPQFVRKNWTNLNGLWKMAVTAKDASRPAEWKQNILVPFCPESALSGVGRLIEPNESLWYQRELPAATNGTRTILNFEAVDYEATVWVNDRQIGKHRGGHTPFSFDITEALQPSGNTLTVKVNDATQGFQLHGKQNLNPKGIWYTRVSGIWQTVWLENVPASHLADVDYQCDIDSKTETLKITPKYATPSNGYKVKATVSLNGQQVAEGTGVDSISLAIANPKLWSPDSPTLYDVKLELRDSADAVIDSVDAYTAFREFGKAQDKNGNWVFTLNGKPLFHWGPLDQGWWPDGLLTPPSDEAMRSDIEFLKAAGFNMIRKHIKVEPRRYYHHCDRIGMLMWQDQVSNGMGKNRDTENNSPAWTRLKPNPEDATWTDEAHEQFKLEYRRMVDHLRDAPCIASWVPFNEAWGQHRTMEVGKFAMELDSTRAINVASGGNFWPVGDVADEHKYPDPGFPLDDARFKDFIKVAGEFGGHGWPVKGHLWKETSSNWGYGGLPKSMDEWKERYQKSLRILNDLRKQGIAAGVYTQTTDVEVEVNGLRTYDRIDKIDPKWLKEQAAILFAD